MTQDQLTTWAAETRRAAAHPEHEWDEKALDWPIEFASVVVEVGGYTGRWALQIADRYSTRPFVFEPQPWACAVCREVLGKRAQVYNVGLGDRDGTFPMGDWGGDGCSFVKPGENVGQMREIGVMFDQCQIRDRIALMMVNIEGYEYTLLPHMFDQGIYPDRLMVQFHDHADPTGDGRRAIDARMADRYRKVWEYWALTAWEKR